MAFQKDPEGKEPKLLEQFADLAGKRVLEIGCGEGRLTWKYAAHPRQVIALDVDHNALRVARADCPASLRERVHFSCASAYQLPLPKETFDIAVLAWSL